VPVATTGPVRTTCRLVSTMPSSASTTKPVALALPAVLVSKATGASTWMEITASRASCNASSQPAAL